MKKFLERILDISVVAFIPSIVATGYFGSVWPITINGCVMLSALFACLLFNDKK